MDVVFAGVVPTTARAAIAMAVIGGR